MAAEATGDASLRDQNPVSTGHQGAQDNGGVSADSGTEDLDAVRAELLAREPIFHRPELGTTRDAYLAMTDDGFWEVGASGRVYDDREWAIDELVRRGKVEGDESWTVSDVRCRELGNQTYAFTYQLDQAGRLTRRLTLWSRESGDWKILYHQGTLITDA